jgi:hypothetical protein
VRTAIALVLSVVAIAARAQTDVVEYCAFDDSEFDSRIPSSAPNDLTKTLWDRILAGLGLRKAVLVLRSADVPNAVAFMGQTEPVIYYNPLIVKRLADVPPDWVASGILAHELGHHQLHHLVTADRERIKDERDADEFSGFALFQLQVDEDHVAAAANSIKNYRRSKNYDPPAARAAQFLVGWRDAKATREKELSRAPPNSAQQDQTAWSLADRWKDRLSNAQPSQVSRVVLKGSQDATYLLSTDFVVAVKNDGVAEIVGKRLPPILPGYAWMYQSSKRLYGVKLNGDLVLPTEDGEVAKVGYVTDK